MTDHATPAFGTFFLPGPTECRPEVLQAMARPMIAHRGKVFESMFARVQVGLQHVFKTMRPVLVSSSSATGLMEAAIRCAPEGPILSIVNGAFSDRFAAIARACGRETDVIDVALGDVATPDVAARALSAKKYAAMTVVHSETSTGALTDVRAMTRVAREAHTLCLVDSVTGLAAAPLHFDEWDMDFALTGSQKALALPPGMAFAVASERYMRTAAATDRGLYFDLVEFENFVRLNQTPNTPALPQLYALDVQLEYILHETIDGRWARHAAMAAMMHDWVASHASRFGVGVFAREGARSPTVTAVTFPERITAGDIVQTMARRGYVIGGGYGPVKATTFRIGHMGDHTVETLAGCLDALEHTLTSLLG